MAKALLLPNGHSIKFYPTQMLGFSEEKDNK
jgi:hypothetical protein